MVFWKKIRKALDDAMKIKSTNRDFRTKDQTVATSQQTKRGLLDFHRKRIVEDDGIHTPTELVGLIFINNMLCCLCCFITF